MPCVQSAFEAATSINGDNVSHSHGFCRFVSPEVSDLVWTSPLSKCPCYLSGMPLLSFTSVFDAQALISILSSNECGCWRCLMWYFSIICMKESRLRCQSQSQLGRERGEDVSLIETEPVWTFRVCATNCTYPVAMPHIVLSVHMGAIGSFGFLPLCMCYDSFSFLLSTPK